MENKIIKKPVALTNQWFGCDTSLIDMLMPSWLAKKENLSDGQTQYANFLEQLKRRHTIETGAIENLYKVDRGVTETLIKEGFRQEILI